MSMCRYGFLHKTKSKPLFVALALPGLVSVGCGTHLAKTTVRLSLSPQSALMVGLTAYHQDTVHTTITNALISLLVYSCTRTASVYTQVH